MQRMIIFILIGTLHVNDVLGNECACAKDDVNVRDAAGTTHNILTTLAMGHCLPFKGHRATVNGESWVNVDYNGHDGWMHEGYVTVSACSSSHVQLNGCPTIITRAEWGARAPSNPGIRLPATPKYMFIHHGASGPCHTKAECIRTVKSYQNYHMDTHGWPDIGYSFVVGEDGNAYEARGWDEVGAHTLGYNSVGLAICVIGDFTNHVPNDAALNTVKKLIECGANNHKLTSPYTLRGHRDMGQTSCPGTKLYELIKTWPHYT